MKRWAIQIGLVIALFSLISFSLGSIDYELVKRGHRPIFVMNWGGFFDGGTYVGFGFGYYVISNHGCKYAMEHGKDPLHAYWTEGPELKFWFFPFLNRSDLHFKPLNDSSANP
jgi:hypothetical protein